MEKDKSSLAFYVDKEKCTIYVQKIFNADLKQVWDAFTKTEILDQWWAPKPWKAETKSRDFTVGGKWVYAMVGPAGEKEWATAEYKSITEPYQFTLIDAFCDNEGNMNLNFPRYNWEVNFSMKNDETILEVIIKQKEFSDLEKILDMGFKEGFSIALEGLEELLQTQAKSNS